MQDKSLLEKREDGKYKLIESLSLSRKDLTLLPLTEDTKLVEYQGNKFRCIAAYEVPIWRIDKENLNGRIYPSALAEKIVKEGKEGLVGLANHPKGDEDGSVTDIFGVYHHPHIREGVFYEDLYLVGPLGQLAHDVIQAGGNVGLSSCGYGDFKKDGKTVDEGIYELNRPADWVLDPSYAVFASRNQEIASESVREAVEQQKSQLPLQEVVTNITVTSEVEAKKESTTMAQDIVENEKTMKLAERMEINLKRGFESYLKNQRYELAKAPTVQEQITIWEEISDALKDFPESDYPELRKEIKENLDHLEKRLNEFALKGKDFDTVKAQKEETEKAKTELQSKYETLEKAHLNLQAKFEKALSLLDDSKVYANKLKDLLEVARAERNGMVTATEYKELAIYNQQLEEQVRFLQENASQVIPQSDVASETVITESTEEKAAQEPQKLDEGYAIFPKPQGISARVRNDSEVEAYYAKLEKNNPGVKAIKPEILRCKTLIEAQMTYLKLKDLVDQSPYARMTVKEKMEESKRPSPRGIQLSKIKRVGWV